MLTDRLHRIIQYHVDKEWEKCRYEDMVVGELPGDSCIVDCLGLKVPTGRRKEVAWYAAQALRRRFTVKNDAWSDLLSCSDTQEELLEIVCREIESALKREPPKAISIEPAYGRVLASGFTEWIPFKNRMAPKSLGVYLLAYFEYSPPSDVSPLDACVIDIGMSASRKVCISGRLDGFALVAQTGRARPYEGKSSGWTYRTEFANDYDQILNFRNLYVSWTNLDEVKSKLFEKECLRAYCNVHDRRPAINKR